MKNILHLIKYRLITFLIIAALLPIFLFGFVLLRKSTNIISEELVINSSNIVKIMKQNIDNMTDNVDSVSTVIIVDTELNNIISTESDNLDKYSNYKNVKKMHDELSSLKYLSNSIDSIYLLDLVSGRGFSTERTGYVTDYKFQEYGWADWIEAWEDDEYIKVITDYITNGNEELLSYRKDIILKGEKKASFFVNINKNTLEENLLNIDIPQSAALWVLNSNNTIIASTGNEEIDFDEFFGNLNDKHTNNSVYNGSNYFFVTEISSSGELKFVFTMPEDTAYKNINKISRSMIILSIILVIVASIVFTNLYSSIYSPIMRLTKVMEKNKTGKTILCEQTTTKDEFYYLIGNFNSMITKIEKLNKELLLEEITNKDAHIKLLQSHINPHFLYNTLDTINWIARLNKVDEISKLTYSMANYYRLSLNEGKNIIKVSEEINLINSYMDIQRTRFSNIDMFIDIDDNIMNCKILKRLFQPIFENAVKHGKLSINKDALIIFTDIDKGSTIKFIIEDNGIGIESEKLEDLCEKIQNDNFSESGNFALRNLNSQIKLFYGAQYELEIESEYGKGTTVTIVIPKI